MKGEKKKRVSDDLFCCRTRDIEYQDATEDGYIARESQILNISGEKMQCRLRRRYCTLSSAQHIWTKPS